MIATPIQYRCDLSDTRRRRVGVEMDVALPDQAALEVYLPQLSPGSTVASQNHAADLLNFQAQDTHGQSLVCEKLPEGGYRLPAGIRGPVKIRYQIRAENFSDVHDQVTPEHAYLNGPATLMCVRGHEHDTPSTVAFTNLPSTAWKSSSTLPRVLAAPHTFYAASYDDIADDNVMMGDIQVAREKVGDTTIEVAQIGTGPYKNLEKPGATPAENVADFARIWRAFTHHFSTFPSQRYVHAAERPAGVEQTDNYVVQKYYLHDGPDQTDGLEHFHGHEMIRHANSENYIKTEFHGSARANEGYTMAHEVVHKLLAKFVQHEGIDAANLERPQPTDGLWVTEGITNWVGYLLERQTGLITRQQYLKRWEGVIAKYYRDYADNPTNARDDSLDAQMGNFNYYNKGSLCGLALDLELRHLSQGHVSMLDVLRKIKTEFGGTHTRYTLDDIQRLTRDVAAPYAGGAAAVDGFFADHLVDRKRIDLDKYLAYAGIALEQKTNDWMPASMPIAGAILSTNEKGELSVQLDPKAAPSNGTDLAIPTLGLSIGPVNKTPFAVTSGGSADDAGLRWYADKTPQQVLLRTAQGDVDLNHPRAVAAGEVTSVVFRFQEASVFDGQSRPVEVVVPAKPASRLELRELAQPTAEQQQIREQWLAQLPEDVLTGANIPLSVC